MNFWRHETRISRKDKIKNTVLKQQMKVIWSFVGVIC